MGCYKKDLTLEERISELERGNKSTLFNLFNTNFLVSHHEEKLQNLYNFMTFVEQFMDRINGSKENK